jgi:hypothetical protein
VFIENWKYEIGMDIFGSIKDPCDNFFEIDTSKILSEGVIRPGNIIATYCGFQEPQRVILDYQPHGNVYNMRIIDIEGNDIPYFGIHHPINYHAIKLADPTKHVNPIYVGLVRKNGKRFISKGFAMKHMNCKAIIDEQATDKPEESLYVKDHVEYPFEWFQNVSTATSQGQCTLVTCFNLTCHPCHFLNDSTYIFFLPCYNKFHIYFLAALSKVGCQSCWVIKCV